MSTEYVLIGGTDYQLTEGSANFDPNTNAVTHTGADIGWWSSFTHDVKGGEQLTVSRHSGLVADGHGQGEQWMLTLDASDGRWKADVNGTRSVIYVR